MHTVPEKCKKKQKPEKPEKSKSVQEEKKALSLRRPVYPARLLFHAPSRQTVSRTKVPIRITGRFIGPTLWRATDQQPVHQDEV